MHVPPLHYHIPNLQSLNLPSIENELHLSSNDDRIIEGLGPMHERRHLVIRRRVDHANDAALGDVVAEIGSRRLGFVGFEVGVVVEVDWVRGSRIDEVEGDHGVHDGPRIGLGRVEGGLAV